jgi:predicted AlkP superfamily pyrophosphatase or phosphodiesterase
MRTARFVASVTAVLALGGCAGQGGVARGGPGGVGDAPSVQRPALAVVLIIDQFRADYLERFRHQLDGGLDRLLREGAVFTDAHQDHAIPETSPGHASILSGRFPRETWIISNATSVYDPEASLVDAIGPGASPKRFVGSTLADWLLARDRETRILSVSRKDVGAIFPVGRSRQPHVYWYAEPAHFTTSRWYRDTLPAWVRAFNARGEPYRWVGEAWTLLLPDTAYREPDSVAIESNGALFTFPHILPADSAEAARWLVAWPWMDELTLSFALHGIEALGLGRRDAPDLLVVSLSTSDAIGHRFGPDSREQHDQVVRLDRAIGRFLDSLFAMRDPAGIAIALTADHGVGSFPELLAQDGAGDAHRVSVDPALAAARASMQAAGIDTLAIQFDRGVLFLNREAFGRSRLDADSIVRTFAATARATDGVRRVDEVSSLARAEVTDTVARRWRHLLPEEAPAELVVTLEPNSVWMTVPNARHDSPYDYDTHVPLIFHGPWFGPGRHDAFVRTVDLAPTLARVLRVRPTERVDGIVLERAFR